MRPTVRTPWPLTPYRFAGVLLWTAMSLAYWHDAYGHDPLSRTAAAGPFNLLVLLTGIGRFARVLTGRPWAAALGLVAMALVWRGHLGWTAAAGDLGHPSTLAVGLAFWVWAATAARAGAVRCRVRYLGPSGLRSHWGYAWLGALYGLILLVDPVACAAAAVGAAAIVAGWERERRAAVWSRWALTAAVPLAVACCGPYVGVVPGGRW
ncbi:fucose 4-O-acetylase-like acetyltransferase [Streptomyces achromogenes]|uniref:Fucose 4-O-acetylase-like acetyltransferase n=1 Tax=Streptomyces achromogenes TaxID=67255 RepID=A0ABU0Q2V3_STRAH|nr:hypothetical protein [Streptomyces achromogenes]MDQ0684195.1 fucose 4-O-acetylase-like acetyltransferase [Streptomyces achromogenes]MDQ0831290.1 fucose 4-O-acetylase-like acetyltransferase [Streptomyces achromogenes]